MSENAGGQRVMVWWRPTGPEGRLPRGLAVLILLVTAVILAADRPAGAPRGTVLSAVDLGPVRWDRRILGRDGGLSARWGDSTIWVFGDTILSSPGADGDRWADNSSAVTSDLDAGDGITLVPPDGLEHPDAARVPGEYLPLSPWEAGFNHRNDPARCGTARHGECGQQYFLWPGPVVPDPKRGRILFFLTAGRRGGAITGYQQWGTGLAVWDAASGSTTRPAQAPGRGSEAGNRWTMFRPGETPYPTMTVTVGQTLYGYGCQDGGRFVFRCRLARVPLAQATSRDAWRFFVGGGRWSADADDAVTVFDGGHSGSVFYNPYLGRYLAVYGFDRAYYRTAPQPWGPWSTARRLFDTVPATRDFNYFVLAHPEYGTGNTLYVTYSRPTEVGWELRLTRVELA
ncbi:MAG: DUF4185 domain-containing protein [Micromonosporaceae bacterium]